MSLAKRKAELTPPSQVAETRYLNGYLTLLLSSSFNPQAATRAIRAELYLPDLACR